jgi:Rrf2 family transcriptional regulator, cysteine metabolism repressor
MKVSARAEYACLAAIALARHRPEAPPLRIREISREYAIPERYLVQILLRLKGAGLVASTRGALGGYRLARPAASISLSEILSAIDGRDTASGNVAAAKRPLAPALASVWEDVKAAENAVLERTTVAQLAEETSPHEWII